MSSFFIFSCKKTEEKKIKLDSENIFIQNTKTDSRISKWQLPILTFEEKNNLVSSVQTVFSDYYVNRLQKIKEYNYDALIEANKLNPKMSSEELLTNTMYIFRNIISNCHLYYILIISNYLFYLFNLSPLLLVTPTIFTSTFNLLPKSLYPALIYLHIIYLEFYP